MDFRFLTFLRHLHIEICLKFKLSVYVATFKYVVVYCQCDAHPTENDACVVK
jgi:hypothetical protein